MAGLMYAHVTPEPFTEQQFLEGDIACLRRMLADLPANARITRMGTESRLRTVEARLQKLQGQAGASTPPTTST